MQLNTRGRPDLRINILAQRLHHGYHVAFDPAKGGDGKNGWRAVALPTDGRLAHVPENPLAGDGVLSLVLILLLLLVGKCVLSDVIWAVGHPIGPFANGNVFNVPQDPLAAERVPRGSAFQART